MYKLPSLKTYQSFKTIKYPFKNGGHKMTIFKSDLQKYFKIMSTDYFYHLIHGQKENKTLFRNVGL